MTLTVIHPPERNAIMHTACNGCSATFQQECNVCYDDKNYSGTGWSMVRVEPNYSWDRTLHFCPKCTEARIKLNDLVGVPAEMHAKRSDV
jgi:hypothetical protein